ncbi:MAG TPA: VWA domain-containing protein [Desulfopila sp.]|nr:VWA domain-containing protein [Desulfopila sp.]
MKTPAITFLAAILLTAGCTSEIGPTADHQEKKEQQSPAADRYVEQETTAVPQALQVRAQPSVRNRTVVSFADDVRPPVPAATAMNRESYDDTGENRFTNSLHHPLSTFSVDVDTASYANIRRLLTGGSLPPAGAVRIEEMINYFDYDYPQPEGAPFSLTTEMGPSPYNQGYRLVSIGIQGRNLDKESLPPSNLVFLVDVSGSMGDANKLPLLQQAMKMLVEQLDGGDRVAIVAYAGNDRIVLSPTAGSARERINDAIDSLASGGSTHASQGIHTAYYLARQALLPNGNNRVILASDGDFNVGVTSRGELRRLVEEHRQSGIFLSVLGFGRGNYHDDTMELLADRGNGNYAYIDSLLEAKKVLVRQLSSTLFTLARDVKIQVEFNPARVGAYRLIGYENRRLQGKDFLDDGKDAGEIGIGHQVSALYELIPAGHDDIPEIGPLKYLRPDQSPSGAAGEPFNLKLRYMLPQQEHSLLLETSVEDPPVDPSTTSESFRFAAAVAGFGMYLQQSPHLGTATLPEMLELGRSARGHDLHGYRAECLRLKEMAELLHR